MIVSNNFIYIFLLIALNGFFVAAEYSLLTLRKTKVDQYVRSNIFGYSAVRKALDNLFAIISVTQLGSTICSILLGWLAEPMIEQFLLPLIKTIPVKEISFIGKSLSITITIVLLSFFQMIFGEIIPKTIALQKSEIISRILIVPLNIFMFLLKPFVFLINGVSNIFLKLIHLSPFLKSRSDYSQEEIKIILKESMRNRTLPYHQAKLLSNIFALQKTPVTKLMINKNKLIYFLHSDTLGEVREKLADGKHIYSRYPVFFTKNLIIGFIHLSDILKLLDEKKDNIKLNETNLIKELLHVGVSFPPDKLLIQMREKGIHAAAVRDNNQEILGIVTLTDIVKFLVDHS